MILLRSAAFGLWFFGVTTLFCLGTPLPRWRARRQGRGAILAYARVWARAVLGGLRVICGIGWRLEGAANLPPPGRSVILAAQHQSTFETLFWTIALPDVAFVVKRELFAVPLFGAMLREAGMIPVDRDAGAAALRGLLRHARAAAASGRPIVIFPEGTRSPPGTIGKLRPGIALLAQRTGLPVVPVATDSGRFWGRLAFRKRPGTIRIAVRPALPPGLARPTLLHRLRDNFESAEAVENSVGGAGFSFSRDRKRTS